MNSEAGRIRSVSELRGIRATVMGLGLNGGGLETARFLASKGASVTVTDMKSEKDLAPSIERLAGLNVRLVLGRHEDSDFANADIVFKNPAVRPDSRYLALASRVETDISLFLSLFPGEVMAVTGSKGKSTVSSAIHRGLFEAGREAFLGGNITISPLGFLDVSGAESLAVLELSSWQLADLKGKAVLKPRVAAITTIMPDHQDRYPSMDAYVADKKLIYSDQDGGDFLVVDMDDGYGPGFAAEAISRAYFCTAREDLGGLRGGFIRGNRGWASLVEGTVEELVPDKLAVPGIHQRRNLLQAAVALRAIGIDPSSIRAAMGSFPGVEHRLELFAEHDGIRFCNDSAATVPQAAAAALASFEEPIVLIAGGRDKALDFSCLAEAAPRAKKLILLAGSGTDKLLPLLAEKGIKPDPPCRSMTEAVEAALAAARTGDLILLSPGCTSFGMFANEFERGRQFKEEVLSRTGKGEFPRSNKGNPAIPHE